MPWKDLPQQAKIEHVRQAFGGMPGAPPTNEFHHYGIYIGHDVALGRMVSHLVTLGPDKVHVSPVHNGHLLALWKIPLGETLLNP